MNLWIKSDTMLTIKREHGGFNIKGIPDGATFKEEGTNNMMAVKMQLCNFHTLTILTI